MSIGAGRRQTPNREVEASGKRTVWLNQCLTTRAPYKGWGEGVRSLSRDFNPSPHPSPKWEREPTESVAQPSIYPSRRDRHLAHVLRHLVALLHGRAFGDGRVPPLHVGILVEIDGLPFVARDPRPDRDVGDRILIGDELAAREPAVEHAVEAVRLFQITFLRVGRLALVVFHEVMDLPEHRS